MSIVVCKIRMLTPNQTTSAMRGGLEVNPANAIDHGHDLAIAAHGTAALQHDTAPREHRYAPKLPGWRSSAPRIGLPG